MPAVRHWLIVPCGVEKHKAACASRVVQNHSCVPGDAAWMWRESREGSVGVEGPTCRSTAPLVALGNALHPSVHPEHAEGARQGSQHLTTFEGSQNDGNNNR